MADFEQSYEKYSEMDKPGYRERNVKKQKNTAVPRKRGHLDLPFLILTVIILSIGVVMVLSASFARAYYTSGDPTKYFTRQLAFAVVGVVIMYFFSRLPVSLYRTFSIWVLVGAIVLLILVPIVGVEENGAKRWINLGFTTFQPSEIAKIAVILCFSTWICNFKEKMKTFRYGVLPFALALLAIVGLLVLEPHFSASIIIIAIGAIMMFAGGTKWYWFAGGAGFVGTAAIIAYNTVDYVQNRVTAWLDPFTDLQGKGWQTVQSLYSIGSGGFLGLGLGQGRQKYLYLPEEHNDFIFSVVCEELGLVGALLILLLFAMLIIRGYWLALHARDRFGALVITGIMSLLAIQVFLNVAVVTNLVPCTGISLPFFSYGGTALLLQMAEMGIVLSISRDIPLQREMEGKDSGKDEE